MEPAETRWRGSQVATRTIMGRLMRHCYHRMPGIAVVDADSSARFGREGHLKGGLYTPVKGLAPNREHLGSPFSGDRNDLCRAERVPPCKGGMRVCLPQKGQSCYCMFLFKCN